MAELMTVSQTTEHVDESTTPEYKKNKTKNELYRCLWIKVPYPVTEECTCSCKKFDE